jgi:hypothetical protein
VIRIAHLEKYVPVIRWFIYSFNLRDIVQSTWLEVTVNVVTANESGAPEPMLIQWKKFPISFFYKNVVLLYCGSSDWAIQSRGTFNSTQPPTFRTGRAAVRHHSSTFLSRHRLLESVLWKLLDWSWVSVCLTTLSPDLTNLDFYL